MKKEKTLKKKNKLIIKNEKKIQQGRNYLVANKGVVVLQQILVIGLFIELVISEINNEEVADWFAPLFCVNAILCVLSIAMLYGYPLRLYWNIGKKVNDILDGVEFLSGISLMMVKIPLIAVFILGYIGYGVGLTLPGVYAIVSYISSKQYAKKLDELEKETAKLKEEIVQLQ